MKEEDSEIRINPKHTIGILRRYLHIIALLQNPNDPKDWNSKSLADTLNEDFVSDEDHVIEDKNIRDDIDKYIERSLGLGVNRQRGKRKMTLEGINSESGDCHIFCVNSR